MEPKSNYRQVLGRVSILCSKSEKCKADIIPILEKAELNGEEIEKAMDYLTKERFIDEERYANNFVHDKFRLNEWGRYKIAYMLRLKKIPEEIISLSLSQISEEDYSKTLRRLLSTKVKFVRGASKLEQKSKLIIFAQTRGFERELASRVVDKIFHSPEDDS